MHPPSPAAIPLNQTLMGSPPPLEEACQHLYQTLQQSIVNTCTPLREEITELRKEIETITENGERWRREAWRWREELGKWKGGLEERVGVVEGLMRGMRRESEIGGRGKGDGGGFIAEKGGKRGRLKDRRTFSRQRRRETVEGRELDLLIGGKRKVESVGGDIHSSTEQKELREKVEDNSRPDSEEKSERRKRRRQIPMEELYTEQDFDDQDSSIQLLNSLRRASFNNETSPETSLKNLTSGPTIDKKEEQEMKQNVRASSRLPTNTSQPRSARQKSVFCTPFERKSPRVENNAGATSKPKTFSHCRNSARKGLTNRPTVDTKEEQETEQNVPNDSKLPPLTSQARNPPQKPTSRTPSTRRTPKIENKTGLTSTTRSSSLYRNPSKKDTNNLTKSNKDNHGISLIRKALQKQATPLPKDTTPTRITNAHFSCRAVPEKRHEPPDSSDSLAPTAKNEVTAKDGRRRRGDCEHCHDFLWDMAGGNEMKYEELLGEYCRHSYVNGITRGAEWFAMTFPESEVN